MKYKLTVYDCNIIEYHGEKKYPIIINSEVQLLNKYRIGAIQNCSELVFIL
jgi:hypothetical protein